jgi:hypothetical protein
MSGNRFGLADAVWSNAKKEAVIAIGARARVRGMITYTELVGAITSVAFDAHDVRLNALLGEVSAEEFKKGRGMITALVVHKVGDMEPGPGFFELAETLGRRVIDRTKFWIEEVHKVHRTWE